MKKMKVSGQFVQQNKKRRRDKQKGNYADSSDGICREGGEKYRMQG